MTVKKNIYRIKKQKQRRFQIKIATVSPTVVFKTIILFSTLVVAVLAIYKNAYDSEIWNFLGSMLMYAALSNGQLGR